jgi:pimeloyl-ACP methyl ester carboxylesterase
MAATLVFIHGLESTAQGTKGQFFRLNFPETIVEDYVGNFAERMKKLSSLLEAKNDLILVGSSFGGLMAAQFAVANESRIIKLILLAPALNLPEFQPKTQKPLQPPVIIYHGINDNIVDPYIVKGIAGNIFRQLEHHLVDDDHSLHKTFSHLDWKKLLRAE